MMYRYKLAFGRARTLFIRPCSISWKLEKIVQWQQTWEKTECQESKTHEKGFEKWPQSAYIPMPLSEHLLIEVLMKGKAW